MPTKVIEVSDKSGTLEVTLEWVLGRDEVRIKGVQRKMVQGEERQNTARPEAFWFDFASNKLRPILK